MMRPISVLCFCDSRYRDGMIVILTSGGSFGFERLDLGMAKNSKGDDAGQENARFRRVVERFLSTPPQPHKGSPNGKPPSVEQKEGKENKK